VIRVAGETPGRIRKSGLFRLFCVARPRGNFVMQVGAMNSWREKH